MLEVADKFCPQYKQKFEEVSLSRGTEVIRKQLISQSKGLFSFTLDESTNIDHTAQLLIFVLGIEITKELLSMKSMKDITTVEDIFQSVKNSLLTTEL